MPSSLAIFLTVRGRRCEFCAASAGRSYRRPYAAITGVRSAHRDKQLAARGVRRRISWWLHLETLNDGEFELVPHRLECNHNNVWGWDRDGRQRLQIPDARDWSCHCLEVNGLHPFEDGKWRDEEWPPRWYERVRRK